MISFTTPGVILRSRDVGSYDRVYSVYTLDRGKLLVRAISIRKNSSKLQSSMQSYALLMLYIIAQRRFTLGGVVINQSFANIEQSLIAQWALQHIREVVDELTKPEHHEAQLFALLTQTYPQINRHDLTLPQALLGVAWFDLMLLRILGFIPDLSNKEGQATLLRHRISSLKLGEAQQKTLFFLVNEKVGPAWESPQTLQDTLAVYVFVRELLHHHELNRIATDTLLKELLSSKKLR